MSCITMVLKSSDVMAVRRAIFSAGAHRVVVSTLPKHAWAASLPDWYIGKPSSWRDAPVRMDVGVDECQADEVVSAFLTTAHVGKIERIVQSFQKEKHIYPALLQAA